MDAETKIPIFPLRYPPKFSGNSLWGFVQDAEMLEKLLTEGLKMRMIAYDKKEMDIFSIVRPELELFPLIPMKLSKTIKKKGTANRLCAFSADASPADPCVCF